VGQLLTCHCNGGMMLSAISTKQEDAKIATIVVPIPKL
jgi:hypothetical protein